MMGVPPTYVLFRVVTVTVTVLLLLAVGFGLRGHGPFHPLGGYGNSALNWLRVTTGVRIR
jgi:hypothetical protein